MNSLLLLRLYYFITFGALGLYLPYFPTWLLARGFRGGILSLLSMLIPLLSIVAPPLVGALADRFAWRGRLITVAAGAAALALTSLSLLSAVLTPLPLLGVFLTLFVFAVFRSPMVGLADVIALEHPSDYGRIRLWGSLGFLSAALLGGRFIEPTHAFQLPVFLSVSLWGSVIASRFLPKAAKEPPRPGLSDARSLLENARFRVFLLTVALTFCGNSAYDFCMSLRLRDLGASPALIGVFWALATGSEIILMQFSGSWLRGRRPLDLMALAAFLAAGRWFLIGTISSPTLLLALQPLHAVTFALLWLSALGTLKEESSGRGMATAQGLFTAAVGSGAALGMSAWGVIYEQYGSRTVFFIATVIGLLGALLTTLLGRAFSNAVPLRQLGR